MPVVTTRGFSAHHSSPRCAAVVYRPPLARRDAGLVSNVTVTNDARDGEAQIVALLTPWAGANVFDCIYQDLLKSEFVSYNHTVQACTVPTENLFGSRAIFALQ